MNAVEPDQKRARFGCGCNFCGMQTGDLDPGAPVPSDTAEASIQIQMSNGTDKYCFTMFVAVLCAHVLHLGLAGPAMAMLHGA